MSQKFSNLYFFGRPFSPLYSGIMKVREQLYLKGLRRSHKLGVPVISVGNLTMGGTGKTPVVGMLASALKDKGFRPAIISRGYGGAAGNKVNVVSDGRKILLDAKAAGDEPCFLAKKYPEIPVLTGIVRVLPCRYAVEKLGCNILILDDGFQHMAVQRDLDLVLFSAATLAGNSRVFPGGDLREPVSALKRCHAFILTGVTDELKKRCLTFGKLLRQRFPEKPVFYFSYEPAGVTSLQNNTSGRISSLPSPLIGFSGIAQPELFQNTLQTQGVVLTDFIPLKDHQSYTQSLIKKIADQASMTEAKGLITTEKDLIKLQSDTFDLPCFALKMEVQADQPFETFWEEKLSFFTR
ncbi:MAG TPA: tetraacyldisaccharide 4'-kinase [Desulfobacterales bacterium]|nr:tetraacyldisaccharide 4'-kinase [Desulfobacterales bacterium]HIP38688.1 tetraacyldisaccharide 4'-kinase [Desulfocapsa sulfexigens]